MILQEYFNEEQCDLCREAGIVIEERDYSSEELYDMENAILNYINENCIDEKFILKEQKFDQIIDIIMDLENEDNQENPFTVEINENDHVELNNGKTGYIIDITNNAYTIEIDEKYKTGNIDDDIIITSYNSIIKLI